MGVESSPRFLASPANRITSPNCWAKRRRASGVSPPICPRMLSGRFFTSVSNSDLVILVEPAVNTTGSAEAAAGEAAGFAAAGLAGAAGGWAAHRAPPIIDNRRTLISTIVTAGSAVRAGQGSSRRRVASRRRRSAEADLRLVHAEVVGHLVPYCILQEFFKVDRSRARRSCGPWKMVMRSGMVEAVADAAEGERAALIEAQQTGLRRLALHEEGHVLEAAAKPGRNGAHGFLHQLVEFRGGHLGPFQRVETES